MNVQHLNSSEHLVLSINVHFYHMRDMIDILILFLTKSLNQVSRMKTLQFHFISVLNDICNSALCVILHINALTTASNPLNTRCMGTGLVDVQRSHRLKLKAITAGL